MGTFFSIVKKVLGNRGRFGSCNANYEKILFFLIKRKAYRFIKLYTSLTLTVAYKQKQCLSELPPVKQQLHKH